MEDTLVKVGMFAYQLRVDCSDNQYMEKWLKHYECPWYLYGQEISPAGKPHIQAIVWFASQVQMAKLRNWWKGKTLNTKQPVSFTKAKRVQSLIKYCSKDGKVNTNLSENDLKLIGSWQDKKDIKKQFRDKLYAYAESIAFKPYTVTEEQPEYKTINDYYENDLKEYEIDLPNYDERREFVVKIFDFYRLHDRFPVRRVVDSLLFKHNYMTSENLYSKWFL